MVGCALPDLIVTNREEPVGVVKVRDSPGCSDHGMLEFRILQEQTKVPEHIMGQLSGK